LVEAICVDPKEAARVWPRVASLIAAALPTDAEFCAVERRVLAGDDLLWLACDGGAILAAAVTELYAEYGEKFCGIVACGGAELSRWIFLIERLEQFARDEACRAVRINGRLGWARVLSRYRVKRVILERPL
jgi:hypothetical protein